MRGRKLAAAFIFLVGALIGASTRTNIWDGYPFWVWLIVLFVAVAICGVGVNMWRSADEKEESD